MNKTIKESINTTFQLPRHSFHRAIKIQPGTTVICEQGTLWLTRSKDYKDYFLKPGEQMVIDKKSNVLIEALSTARVSIVNPN
jgi:hypothetical protein